MFFDFYRKYYSEIWIFTLALGARFFLLFITAYFYGDEVFHSADSILHALLAKSLIEGKGFSINGVEPFSFYMPGYAVFLASVYRFFGSFFPALIIQAVLGSLFPVFVLRFCRELNIEKTIGIVAGIFAALEPHLVYFSVVYVTETLFTFIFLLAVLHFLMFLKTDLFRYLVLAAVFLGISAYVRAVGEFLVVVFLAAMAYYFFSSDVFLKSKRFFEIILFAAIFGLVVAPWAIRNYLYFGSPDLTSEAGFVLYTYEAASVLAVKNDIPYSDAKKILGDELLKNDNINFEGSRDLKNSPAVKKRAAEIIMGDLVSAAKVAAINILSFWTSSNVATLLAFQYEVIDKPFYVVAPTHLLIRGKFFEAAEDVSDYLFKPYYFLSVVGRLFWFLVSIFCFLGLRRFFRESSGAEGVFSVFIIVLFLYFTAAVLIIGLGVDGRQRFPIEIFMLLFAVYRILSYDFFRRLFKMAPF